MSRVKQRVNHTPIITALIASLLIVNSLIFSGNVQAASVHQEIENQIKEFLLSKITVNNKQQTQITVSAIDQRKKLSPCSTPLIFKITGKYGIRRNNTIYVDCPEQWSIYVPVKIKTLERVVVATTNLSPGTLLTRHNLILSYQDTSLMIGETMTKLDKILGSKVKRYIQQGRPLLANLICLVCKNEPVSITVISGSMRIKSLGIATSDGSLGQVISVKNKSSGRLVDGTVVAVGRVEIKL